MLLKLFTIIFSKYSNVCSDCVKIKIVIAYAGRAVGHSPKGGDANDDFRIDESYDTALCWDDYLPYIYSYDGRHDF